MSLFHQPFARSCPPVPDQDVKPCPPTAISLPHQQQQQHHHHHHHGFHSGASASHDAPGPSSGSVAELASLISYDEVASNNNSSSTAMRALVTFLRDFMQTQSLYDQWTEPRYCPMSYCSEVLESPYALIQHVLSCPQLATGQFECWKCQDWHEVSAVGQERWQSNPIAWKGSIRHDHAPRGRCTTPKDPRRRKHSSTPPGRSRIAMGGATPQEPATEYLREQGVGLQIPNLEELSHFLSKPQLELICHGLEELGEDRADTGVADDGQSMDFDMDVSTCTSPSVLSLDYAGGDFSYASSRASMHQDYQSINTAYSDIDAASRRSIHEPDCDVDLEVDHPMLPFWPTHDLHRMSISSAAHRPPPIRTQDLGGPHFAGQHQYLVSPQSPFDTSFPGPFSGAHHQAQHHQTQPLSSPLDAITTESFPSFNIGGHDAFAVRTPTRPSIPQPQHHQLSHNLMDLDHHRRNSISHFAPPSFHGRSSSIGAAQRLPQLHHPQPIAQPQPQPQAIPQPSPQTPTPRRSSIIQLPTRTTPTPAPPPAPSAPQASEDLVCDECQWKPRGVKENLRGYLRKHKNVHKNLKHACDVDGCTKSFSRLDNLKAHKKDKHPGVTAAPVEESKASGSRLGSLVGSASRPSGGERKHRGQGWAPQRAMLWSSMQM